MTLLLALWLGSSSVLSTIGAAAQERHAMESPDAAARRKDCLHRSTTEEMCHRRCPGEPEGDCIYRVRAEQEKKRGPK